MVSCTQPSKHSINKTEKLNETIDSLLIKSQRNIDSATVQLTKSDSTVVEKVDHTVQKIQHLETENKQLKAENNELKDKLGDAIDAGKSYHIRAISNDQNN